MRAHTCSHVLTRLCEGLSGSHPTAHLHEHSSARAAEASVPGGFTLPAGALEAGGLAEGCELPPVTDGRPSPCPRAVRGLCPSSPRTADLLTRAVLRVCVSESPHLLGRFALGCGSLLIFTTCGSLCACLSVVGVGLSTDRPFQKVHYRGVPQCAICLPISFILCFCLTC